MRRCATTLESELKPAELEFLEDSLSRSRLPDRHLEIGVAAGGTLWRLMRCYQKETTPRFIVVDPLRYFPNQLETVHYNLRRNGQDPSKVDFRQDSSTEAFEKSVQRRETFDFILVDACHKLEYVMQDLRWARLLNVHGILALHDYSSRFPGVKWATDRFLATHSHFEPVALVESLVVLKKTSVADFLEVTPWDLAYSWFWSLPLRLEKKLFGTRKAA